MSALRQCSQLRRSLWLGLRASLGGGAIALFAMADASSAACDFFSAPQSYNTQTVDDVVVIGYQPDRPYRVVVLSGEAQVIQEIRECVLDAFVTRSRSGDYIQVASFDRRGDAEIIRRVLRESGYPSRVVYGR